MIKVEKKSVLFIVNPISGGKDKKKFLQFLEKLNPPGFEIEVAVWAKKNDWESIEMLIKSGKYDIIAPAGGDGTVNLVGSAMIGSSSILAIIPFGSGNGLARHLKIPLDPFKALQLIFSGKHVTIDCGVLNGNPFFITAGCGFDAVVAHSFAKSSSRGFLGYAVKSIKALFHFKPIEFNVTADEDTEFKTNAFLFTVANANQYGNDFKIAPAASVMDGKLNLSIIRPFHWTKIPELVLAFASGEIEKFSASNIFPVEKVKVSSDTLFAIHIDGEPAGYTHKANFEIYIKALKVMTSL